MSQKFLLFIGALVILVVATALIYSGGKTENNASPVVTNTVNSRCGTESDPVCGEDGKTYLNQCLAGEANIRVVLDEPCPTETLLTADERKQLLFFLRARQDAQLPSVPTRHVLTEASTECSVNSCKSYYYTWGSPPEYALVYTEDDVPVRVVDSTGFDYLAQTQGGPISFPSVE